MNFPLSRRRRQTASGRVAQADVTPPAVRQILPVHDLDAETQVIDYDEVHRQLPKSQAVQILDFGRRLGFREAQQLPRS